jgi:hypothetical protein
MEKLDRLVWAAGLSIHAYGRRVGIRSNDPAVLDRIRELLPPGWEPCFSPLVEHLFSLRVGPVVAGARLRHFHLLYGGHTLHARSLDLDEVLRELEAQLHLYVGQFASNRVFVHAGVVGWRGQALLLPGPSRAGKSTLVAALLRHGAHYLSDEYAVLCPDGLVHPFARRLSIRQAGGTTRRCLPEEFTGRVCEGPLPVGLVAVTEHLAGTRTWRPRLLTPGQAVLALLEHTLTAQADPEGSLGVLHNAVRSALLLRGPRGEADDAARYLIAALEEERRPCTPEPGKRTSPSANCPTRRWSTIGCGTRPTV